MKGTCALRFGSGRAGDDGLPCESKTFFGPLANVIKLTITFAATWKVPADYVLHLSGRARFGRAKILTG